jgi:homoserine kinase type II
MAVYTEVSDGDLVAFAAAYDIGRVLSCKGIAEGVENSNFLLRTEGGTFILTLYEKRVAPKELPFFLGLLDHLAGHGLDCPRPVRTHAGEALGQLAGRPAAIVTFLEGMWSRQPDVRQCAAVGEALALLHRYGADYPMSRPNALSIEAWPQLFASAQARADEVQADLGAFIESELAHLQNVWPQNLPHGIIHADLFPDNVLFLGEQLSGVIDFYFACTDAYAYDLAICLNAWCFERDLSYNATKAAALCDGYERVRKLQPEEAAALPTLARGAALRFALTRLVEWLNVPPGALVRPKDPLDYVRRLRFHHHVKDAAELGLAH